MKVDENGNIISEAPEVSAEDIQEFITDEVVDKVDKVEGSEETATTEATSADKEPVVEDAQDGSEEVDAKGVADATSTATPEVVAPVVDDPIAALNSRIEALTAMVDKLSTGASPASKTPEVPSTQETVTLDSLLENVNFDAIMESKEEFVKFFRSAMAVVREETAQKTLMAMPEVVGSVVSRQATLHDVAREFFKTYPELQNVKGYVAKVSNEISATNPDWTIGQVLTETAKVVKETLQLNNVVATGDRKAAMKPSLPGGSGGSKVPSKPSTGLQAEIDSLIND